MHAEALDFVKRATADLKPKSVVEIGSLYTAFGWPVEQNPLRDLFKSAQRYVGIDVRAGPGVDEVADGATSRPPVQEPFKPTWAPDLVLCCEVLEHVDYETQAAILENAYAMLTPGGLLVVTAATEPRAPHTWDGHAHGTPDVDYWNVKLKMVVDVLADAERAVEIDEGRGDIYVSARAPVVAYA